MTITLYVHDRWLIRCFTKRDFITNLFIVKIKKKIENNLALLLLTFDVFFGPPFSLYAWMCPYVYTVMLFNITETIVCACSFSLYVLFFVHLFYRKHFSVIKNSTTKDF